MKMSGIRGMFCLQKQFLNYYKNKDLTFEESVSIPLHKKMIKMPVTWIELVKMREIRAQNSSRFLNNSPF